MPQNPRAILYGPDGPFAGVAGVLVATDVAAFSPWPPELDYRTPFAVRIIADDKSAEEWASPTEVVYLRLAGAQEGTNVAGVRLASDSSLPIVLGQRVSDGAIIEALDNKRKGCRGALLDLGADRFAGLANRRRVVPALIHPIDDNAVQDLAVVPESFLVRTGPPGQAEFSICRIFRWD